MGGPWSGPDGHRPGKATVHRRGAGAGRRAGAQGSRGPHERRRPSRAEADPPPYRLTPGSGAPRRAREVVASRLAEELDQDRVEDAVLLVSELVTNSLLHAELGDGGWIDLTVRLGSQAVRVEVEDSGSGFGPRRHELPPPERVDGRGLYLVRELSDRCGVAPGGTSRVWFELDR